MLSNLNFSSIFTAQNLKHLMWGVQYTVLLTLTSWVLAVALGTVLATLRAIGNPLIEKIVAGYVAFHQNVPMLAQLFLWYFGVPTLLPDSAQAWINSHGANSSSRRLPLACAWQRTTRKILEAACERYPPVNMRPPARWV